LQVASGQLVTMQLEVTYPYDLAVTAWHLPGKYVVDVSMLAWRMASTLDLQNSGADLITSLSLTEDYPELFGALRSDAWYVPVELSNVTVQVTAVVGFPNATRSEVFIMSALEITSHDDIRIGFVLRDGAGFLLSANLSLVEFFEIVATVPTTKVFAVEAVSGVGDVLMARLLPQRLGVLSLNVSISGSLLQPPMPLTFTILPVECDHSAAWVVDDTGLSCECNAGLFLSAASETCVPCRSGTFKPRQGNGSVASCIPCPSGYYCFEGSETVTGQCPALGFDCSGGTLVVEDGYWVENSTDKAFLCQYREACQGKLITSAGTSLVTSCAVGYVGYGCAVCDRDFAGLSGYCAKCYGPTLAVMGLVLMHASLVFVIGLVAALLLEESRGVSKVRSMWVLGHKDAIVLQVRVLFDMLQVVGLQVLIKSLEQEWFVTGVLSLTGGVIGGGFSVQTWLPYLCLIPSSHEMTYWLQLSAVVWCIPVAVVAGLVSQWISKRLWRGEW
jgi:hypothetical protein